MPTVIQYIIKRLNELGITEIFGVPGDYQFHIAQAIDDDPNVRWVSNCNELNAAYSAMGYASIKGVGAMSCTFGVGELNATGGIGGANSERYPVFQIVGMPSRQTINNKEMMHHTFNDGNFRHFHDVYKQLTCSTAIISPENCSSEMERLIACAFYERQPVYMGIPLDVVDMQITQSSNPIAYPHSNPRNLQFAVDNISQMMTHKHKVAAIPGYLLQRYDVADVAQDLIQSRKLPFAQQLSDLNVIDQQLPSFLGVYNLPEVFKTLQECDLVIFMGCTQNDTNTSEQKLRIDSAKCIYIDPHRVCIGDQVIDHVEISELLHALSNSLSQAKATSSPYIAPKSNFYKDQSQKLSYYTSSLTSDNFWQQVGGSLREDDVLLADVGAVAAGLFTLKVPRKCQIITSVFWGAIGWSLPTAFGAQIAAKDRRVILVIGDGSIQQTVQEVGQFSKYNLKPLIFVINNGGYLIERLICKRIGLDPESQYNDVEDWRYADIPKTFGGSNWVTKQIKTVGDLSASLAKTQNQATFLEVMLGKYDVPSCLKLLL